PPHTHTHAPHPSNAPHTLPKFIRTQTHMLSLSQTHIPAQKCSLSNTPTAFLPPFLPLTLTHTQIAQSRCLRHSDRLSICLTHTHTHTYTHTVVLPTVHTHTQQAQMCLSSHTLLFSQLYTHTHRMSRCVLGG